MLSRAKGGVTYGSFLSLALELQKATPQACHDSYTTPTLRATTAYAGSAQNSIFLLNQFPGAKRLTHSSYLESCTTGQNLIGLSWQGRLSNVVLRLLAHMVRESVWMDYDGALSQQSTS